MPVFPRLRLPLNMEEPKKKPKFTLPRLRMGKAIKHVPKGSTLAKEQAKQHWDIVYRFEDEHGDMKLVRVTENLNRIKDPNEKLEQAKIAIASLTNDLNLGYNPFDDEANTQIARGLLSIPLKEALVKYNDYHKGLRTKKRTVETYSTNLNQLSEWLGEDIIVNSISTAQLERYALSRINAEKDNWGQTTVQNFKRNLSTFFNWLKSQGYIDANPCHSFNKKVKSLKDVEEVHVPYAEEDIKTLMDYLSEKDKFTALFCRIIYHTCLRPKEIKGLKIKDIDLNNRIITVPASVKKVTVRPKPDKVHINDQLARELEKLNIGQFPKDYYLFGSTRHIIGEKAVGKNTPLVRLGKALELLKMDNKGYDLYGFKHTANIDRLKDGCSVDKIMKLNRHKSPMQTLVYIRRLSLHTNLENSVTRDI